MKPTTSKAVTSGTHTIVPRRASTGPGGGPRGGIIGRPAAGVLSRAEYKTGRSL